MIIDPNTHLYGPNRNYFEDVIESIYAARNKITTPAYITDIYARHIKPYEKQILAEASVESDDDLRHDSVVEQVAEILKQGGEI